VDLADVAEGIADRKLCDSHVHLLYADTILPIAREETLHDFESGIVKELQHFFRSVSDIDSESRGFLRELHEGDL